jgi:uncharacterized protein YcaQ
LRTIETLSAAQARRLALAAQGFAAPRPDAPPGWRTLRARTRRLGLLQIDSVNVLVRAHYLPLFSRLGAYDRAAFDAKAYRKHRSRLFEYWGHEASLIPVEHQPLWRWRMARAERLDGIYGRIAEFVRARRGYVDAVLARIAAEGPLSAAEFAGSGKRTTGWWGWHDGKIALEYLFWAGLVTTAARGNGFERSYDLPQRVLPRAVLDAPTPAEDEAQRALVLIAAQALGVATAADLNDYFRLEPAATRRALGELVAGGALVPVAVEGWRQPGYLDAAARLPRQVRAAALLAPFDPLIWERRRTERLFDFRYRLELYTPKARRVYGYYVLPFLLGDRLVARVDVKAERTSRTLLVHAAHPEPGIDRGAVAGALMIELATLAAWLALERIKLGGAAALPLAGPGGVPGKALGPPPAARLARQVMAIFRLFAILNVPPPRRAAPSTRRRTRFLETPPAPPRPAHGSRLWRCVPCLRWTSA